MTKWIARGVLGLFGFTVYLMISLGFYYGLLGIGSRFPSVAFLIVPAFLGSVALLVWSMEKA